MPNSSDFNHFQENPTDIQISRSYFNMDHSVKFSCNVGDVIPFDVIECLPGDTFTIDTSRVVRLQPLVTPIMDEIIQDTYWFFCPMRLTWTHAKEFFGENTHGPWAYENQSSYVIPQIEPPDGGWNVGTIADYLGVPPKVDDELGISALPFRAYALICDEWFRSEAVMNPVAVDVGDASGLNHVQGSNGSDQVTDIQKGGAPFVACKFFDYFTSCLPSPQRGDAANVFPIQTLAPVVSMNDTYMSTHDHPFKAGNTWNSASSKGYNNVNVTYKTVNNVFDNFPDGNSYDVGIKSSKFGWKEGVSENDYANGAFFSNLYSVLNSTSFNINDLRSAFAVQRYLEKSARFGGRYISFVKGFFGVDSPDARLQRTEYLGGSRLSLNINSVSQTSATESGSTPQGNVAGMSVTADYNSDFTYSCTEHGFIIGISVLRYHHSYQQGINRMWLKKTFTDFYLPTFAFLGEQAVSKQEIYYGAARSAVFGYQERWAEYRVLPNRVAGEMRSVATTPLDMWHLGDNYASAPSLSPEWLREDKTMLDRCLAVTSEVANQCICDFFVKTKAARPLPLYSIPGMIDHY